MSKNPANKTLRIKLTDFLGSDVEEYVIFALQSLTQDIPIQLSVTMWYSQIELNTKLLDTFKHENPQLISNLNIQFFYLNGYETYTWYDIISKSDESRLNKYYFRLIYDNPLELPTKLIEFKNFIKHYGQKNEKHSYDRFQKLARPSQN